MTTLTLDERAALAMFRPETYCIDLTDKTVREGLLTKGMIEWVPGQAWSGRHTYAITPAGRIVRDAPCAFCAHPQAECVCTDDDRGY